VNVLAMGEESDEPRHAIIADVALGGVVQAL